MPIRRTRASVAVLLCALLGVGLTAPVASQGATHERASVRQQGTTRLLPPVAQQGTRVASAGRARIAGTVSFSPARRGRQVVIQRRVRGGAWMRFVVRRQNSRGVVAFRGAANQHGRPLLYRGVALRHRSLPAVSARSMSTGVWNLRFSDQFSGTSLDDRKWSHRIPGRTIESRTRSVGAEDAVAVGGGSLRLLVLRDPVRPGRYLNGHVGTQGKFSFTRGMAAARIKFQSGQGQHGAFWMQPDAPRRIPGAPRRSGAEIDVAEYFGRGHANGGLGSFLYNYGILGNAGRPKRMGAVWPEAKARLGPRDDFWKSFHVFSVQWTRSSYTFSIDGHPHWRTRAGVSGIDEHLILSLLTSDYELPRLDTATLPSRMHVDWVRVWQK